MSSGREENISEGRGGLRREMMEVGGGRTGLRRGAGEGGRERKGGR